jgi:signal transduction histidine kinase
MKKHTIRFRFFIWLAVHTALVFLSIGLALLSFDFYEYMQDANNASDEIEEMLVVLVAMAFLFPISLAGAWYISRRLLRPWQSLVMQAERICGGQLGERIEVETPSDEIGRLAATLNATFDGYQNLLDRLQRFSYDASHQLRNPLAAIRTNGEVCLKHPRTAEEYRSVIGGILEDTARLSRTVDQLLMLARAASGALEEYQTRVCLQDVAREVVREGQSIGETRGLSVVLVAPETPLLVRGIPELLREALANLLDNALRFSPDDGLIEIGLSQPAAETVRLTVSDSGPGLAPEQKATIFRPFTRSEGSGKESTGLGLAIVADICRAHAGHFGVDDQPGGGCCFWLEFPRIGTG